MATLFEFAVFTIIPIAVMVGLIAYSSIKVHDLQDKRPVLLIALLTLMTLHQMTEILEYAAGTYYLTSSPAAESFETGANLLASVASYYVLQQISDLRSTKNELAASNRILKERTSMVEVLNRILRHNVRNDVNIISGYTTTIQNQIEDDQLGRHLHTIKNSASRLSRISERTQRVQKLLSEEPTRTTELYLPDCLETPIERVDEHAPEANISIEEPGDTELVTRGPSTFPTALADVVEVIVETNDGPVNIDISVDWASTRPRRSQDTAKIVVEDDCEGLPQLDVEAIENEKENPLSHAEGLSLWSLKWAVERANGTLDAHTPDATVEIRLPLSA